MEKKIKLIIVLCLAGLYASCSNKENKESLTSEYNESYKKFKTAQIKMEGQQQQLQNEKDTLLNRLKKSKGSFSAETEMFSEKYKKFLEEQSGIVDRHNEVLGNVAKLEDDVTNESITPEEADSEFDELVVQEKKLTQDFTKRLKVREEFIKEYDFLLKN